MYLDKQRESCTAKSSSEEGHVALCSRLQSIVIRKDFDGGIFMSLTPSEKRESVYGEVRDGNR